MKGKKVICVHLFNDYSGSPLIFANVIRELLQKGVDCEVYTCGGRQGFLSGLDVTYHYFPYKWVSNRLVKLVLFLFSQLFLMCMLFRYWRKDVTFYVNTFMPFGAGLAGWLIRKPVVYHVHETSLRPPLLKQFVRWVANLSAWRTIYVSKYLMQVESLRSVRGEVVYNAVSRDFENKASGILRERRRRTLPRGGRAFTVIMACSLRQYKGVDEFVALASCLPRIRFDLVLNANQLDIVHYFKGQRLPANLGVQSTQKNMHLVYQRAHLVINLSKPSEWVETFGMTLLEGMCYGLPCIAPPIGGPAEIVRHEYNGYLVDQQDMAKLVEVVQRLASGPRLYWELSKHAEESAKAFSIQHMIKGVWNVLAEVSQDGAVKERAIPKMPPASKQVGEQVVDIRS